MLEVQGDLWVVAAKSDAVVVSTNGAVKANGACVMGRGVALDAARRWPRLPFWLGETLLDEGNHVHWFEMDDGTLVISFPVKTHWTNLAVPGLISRSAEELVAITGDLDLKSVALPRVGCGNGGLSWADVRPLLAGVLDDRFTVVSL